MKVPRSLKNFKDIRNLIGKPRPLVNTINITIDSLLTNQESSHLNLNKDKYLKEIKYQNQTELYLRYASSVQNKNKSYIDDLKSVSNGEDAYFVDKYTMAVSDGVGYWKKLNGNSSFYSAYLLHFFALELGRSKILNGDINLFKILNSSIYNLMNLAKVKNIIGSCTALVATLDNNTLKIANLGDSRLLIIRNLEIVYKTKLMQHRFNCPYQIGHHSTDTVNDFELDQFEVKPSDILVMGSDGIFANLFENDILSIIKYNINMGLQFVCDYIVNKTKEIIKNNDVITPFSVNAKANNLNFKGGKNDDITLMMALISN